MSQINKIIKLIDEFYNNCSRGHLISKASPDRIDLTKINDFSYSAVMRDLRKKCDEETVREFLLLYKICFDLLINNEIDKAAEIALIFAVDLFNSMHPLKLKVDKIANASNLGNATLAGQYLASIIGYMLNRISPEKRAKAVNTVARKIYLIDENALGAKHMPESSTIGQSIGFVKHVLLGNDPQYIRAVINSLTASLR